jgi:hypothetical protein
MVLWQQQQQQYQGYHEVDNKTARKERGGGRERRGRENPERLFSTSRFGLSFFLPLST